MISAYNLVFLVLLGGLALFVLIPRVLPAARISLWLRRERRERRRGPADDMQEVAAFHDQSPQSTRAVPDRVWADLNLDDVFRAVDHTESEPGRQYLYHLLRTPHQDRGPLEKLERAVLEISRDEERGRVVRTSLRFLDEPQAAQIVRLIFGNLPRRPKFWWIFPLLTAASIVSVGAAVVWPAAVFAWLALALVNVAIQLVYKVHVKAFAPAIHEIPSFLRTAEALGKTNLGECTTECQCLRDGAAQFDRLGYAARWIMFETGQAGDFVGSLYEYFNLFFLFDINAFMFATASIHQSRGLLQSMFEAIGYVDAAQSIAAWRATLPFWTVPEFTAPAKVIRAEDVIHPLLRTPVANSLSIDNTSVLLTGSNMSGKTTFVRAIGVNAILAQTLHTACARAWAAPMLHVRTSIGRSDNILAGKSYYLAEVETALTMVRAKEDGGQYLFLLDEIFRGTNTTERVAAAYAVLSYLNRGEDLVLVATHDIELLDLLGSSFASYHFREQVADETLLFDYRIYSGPSSTRNAIALLKLLRFPDDLVADALATVDWQSRAR